MPILNAYREKAEREYTSDTTAYLDKYREKVCAKLASDIELENKAVDNLIKETRAKEQEEIDGKVEEYRKQLQDEHDRAVGVSEFSSCDLSSFLAGVNKQMGNK